MGTDPGFDWQEVVAARERLRGVARRTPLLPAQDVASGATFFVKPESLQLTHAFKFRGAYNRVSQLTPAERSAGLIAASSGNHALGLSLAGQTLGARVTVVMPLGAPVVKEMGCRRYGAQVVRAGETYDDAVQFAHSLAREHGYTYVQSFDDPLVAAGQATVAWEIVEDLPDLELIVAPIGGGGLLAGILGLIKTMPEGAAATWFPQRGAPLSSIKVVGVQAGGAASTVESVRAGRRLTLPAISTVADGIAVRQPGAWTFGIIRSLVDDLVTVADEEMLEALGAMALREKLVVEPAGAAAVAALVSGKAGAAIDLGAELRKGRQAVAVISGGNVEPRLLGQALAAAAAPAAAGIAAAGLAAAGIAAAWTAGAGPRGTAER
jgi:threonine dehydratase